MDDENTFVVLKFSRPAFSVFNTRSFSSCSDFKIAASPRRIFWKGVEVTAKCTS